MMMLPSKYSAYPNLFNSADRNQGDLSGHLKALHDHSLSSSSSAPSMPGTLPAAPIAQLGIHFAPGPNDVICHRGKEAYFHPGNKNFRKLAERYTEQYATAPNKAQRSCIVIRVIEKVRSMGSGVVRKQKDGTWIEVGDIVVRKKVGSLFRNALSNRYKSSTSSKRWHRHTQASKTEAKLHNIMMSNQQIKSITEAMAKYTGKQKLAANILRILRIHKAAVV